MNLIKLVVVICVFTNALFVSQSVLAGNWRFPVGIVYVEGLGEIADLWVDNRENEGQQEDRGSVVPISAMFSPYYRFDNGIGVGLGFGPDFGRTAEDDEDGGIRIAYFNFPVHFDLRWAFLPAGGGFSPYIRGGMRKNFASGDDVVEGKIGPFGGVGFEYLRPRGAVDFGLEFTVDKSEIEFEVVDETGRKTSTKNIQPHKSMITFHLIFGKS